MPRLPYQVADCALIFEIRAKSLQTQQEFASIMGVSEATVQNWESGRSNPLPRHLRKLLKLAREFEIGAEKLVEKKFLQQKFQ